MGDWDEVGDRMSGWLSGWVNILIYENIFKILVGGEGEGVGGGRGHQSNVFFTSEWLSGSEVDWVNDWD